MFTNGKLKTGNSFKGNNILFFLHDKPKILWFLFGFNNMLEKKVLYLSSNNFLKVGKEGAFKLLERGI